MSGDGNGGGQSYGMPSMQFQNKQSDPWGPAQPALNKALGGAINAYDTTYQGPSVASYDPNITAGENAILRFSQNNQAGNAATSGIGEMQRILDQGGLSNQQYQGLGTLGGVEQNLNPYATGEYLKQGGNPYLDAAIQRGMNDAAQGVNAQFSSAGRYGSGAQTNALTDRLGGIATNARMQDYQQQQANQLAANQALSGIAGQYAGIGQQGIGNIYGSGSALSGLSPLQTEGAIQQMGVGQGRQDYQQSLIDAANQAPWARVGNLANVASGIGGLGGTSQGWSMGFQPQQKQSSTLQNILGGGLGLLGVGTNLAKGGGLRNIIGGMW